MLFLIFYREASGKEPVREWLLKLDQESRKIIGQDIKTVQFRWPIGPPLTKPLGGGLWEVRSTLVNRIARVIFVTKDQHIILLHGFIKKTQKTPPNELEIARMRLKSLNCHGD